MQHMKKSPYYRELYPLGVSLKEWFTLPSHDTKIPLDLDDYDRQIVDFVEGDGELHHLVNQYGQVTLLVKLADARLRIVVVPTPTAKDYHILNALADNLFRYSGVRVYSVKPRYSSDGMLVQVAQAVQDGYVTSFDNCPEPLGQLERGVPLSMSLLKVKDTA